MGHQAWGRAEHSGPGGAEPSTAPDRLQPTLLRRGGFRRQVSAAFGGCKHRTFSQWVVMNFEIISEIRQIETIAIGRAIRDLARLRRAYGTGRWRKLKGIATIRLANGRIRVAELHWYEAHGIGRKEIKRKRYLD